MSSFSSFLNRKPCRRVVVLVLVLVVIPLSGRMFYVNKLEFARRMASDGVHAAARRREEVYVEERGGKVVHQKMVAQHREEEGEEKRPLEAPTT